MTTLPPVLVGRSRTVSGESLRIVGVDHGDLGVRTDTMRLAANDPVTAHRPSFDDDRSRRNCSGPAAAIHDEVSLLSGSQ